MDGNSILIMALAAVAAFLVSRKITQGRKAPPETVLAKIKGGALVVDVRTAEEFAGGAYRKAKNVPLDRLQARIGELGAKTRPIVVYCASGSRSAQATGMLRKAGFTDVTNAGGLSGMPR